MAKKYINVAIVMTADESALVAAAAGYLGITVAQFLVLSARDQARKVIEQATPASPK